MIDVIGASAGYAFSMWTRTILSGTEGGHNARCSPPARESESERLGLSGRRDGVGSLRAAA